MSKEIFTDMTGSNKSIYNKRLIAQKKKKKTKQNV